MKSLVRTTMGLVPATLVAFGVMAGTTQAFAGASAETVKQDVLEKNNKTATKLDSQLIPNSSEHQSSDKYTEVNIQEPYMKDAELHVYSVKDDKGSPAAEITITYKNAKEFCPQLLGVREYTAAAKEGWVFKNWTYEQFFNGKSRGDYKAGFYSFSESHDHKTTPYTSGSVISVNRTSTIGESALIKRIYKVYANLNPTITATAGEGGSITSAGQTEVQYGENQKYEFNANDGYVIASLKIDGVEQQNVEHTALGSYEFKAVKSPHKIDVSFEKTYTITYTDGVEGEEIFKNQVTSGILSGTKTPGFTGTPSRKGYTFNGWNPTIADKVTADATYVAQWIKDPFTVTFKDGDNQIASVKVDTGKAIATDTLTDQSMPQNPTKTGYTFQEWNTQKDGRGTAFTGTSVVNGDMTVYAIYTQDPVPKPQPKPQPKTPAPKTPDPKPQPKTPAPKPKPKPQSATSAPETLAPKPQSPTLPKTPAPKSQPTTAAPKSAAFKPQPETSAPKLQPEIPALKLRPETPAPKTPTPKLQPEKHIGMLPKTGESASYAGVFVALGFLIAGLAILRKKNMLEENNK